MKTDIEISREANIKDITLIAGKLGIKEENLELYGKYKAKIKPFKGNKNGKLILVTSTNPTPFGEGKTTMSIGISDALNALGKLSTVVLREPSLGPVFGIKGGATGGGYSQVIPMEDINLHFTGDIHAVTAANNLLCAAIDNHIFQGNSLNLDPNKITFKRCMDINDRALRKITVAGGKNETKREDSFNISVASEIMAILCLSNDLMDLKEKLANILIGYTYQDKPVFAKDLHIEGALALLLKDAIKPNLVQTLENNPAIIHGGPFANIAHGCNSIIATKLALSLSHYVVTEAGFGSDLGAEKFFDIKCRKAGIKPNCVVINSTIRSIKYNAYVNKEDLEKESIDSIKKGICNLEAHINNMKKFTNNIIVCLNKFNTDTEEEINFVKDYVENMGVDFEVCSSFSEGSKGAISLAKKIVDICDKKVDFKYLYDLDLSIIEKIEKVSKEIYHASSITYLDNVKEEIEKINNLGFSNYPVCIAKTQYSLSDDAKKLGNPTDYEITVKEIRLCTGAGFIVVLLGDILTMPGLSKNPAYINMDIDKNEIITGLF